MKNQDRPSRPGDEPLPGYQLLERLGSGGYGDVWKATAPGGLLKAIKICHGTLTRQDDDRAGAEQELRGLERVKSARHPYILSLERYDIVAGQLIIVMELADGTLWDRFRACRAEGLPGIPRDELLRRLAEAAEALDLLNHRYQLQHLDVKPQNLFLLCDHVKVGDFGLVKDLVALRTASSGGLSVGYSAPEMFDGQVSSACDQYSLAIVYQELLTGRRPFDGASPHRLMAQHRDQAPDLESLPADDRVAIARALAKEPEDRFASCEELIRALRPGCHDSHATLFDFGVSHDTRLDQPRPSGLVRPDGDLVPTVIVGLGAAGGAVLRQYRKAHEARHGMTPLLPHVRLLHLDVDAEALRSYPGVQIAKDSVLHLPLRKHGHYVKKVPGRPETNAWLPQHLLRCLSREPASTEGRRHLGRLAFMDHYPAIAQRLCAELRACANPVALMATTRQTGLQFRTDQPRVVVATSLAGGAGSGMFLDVAYVAQLLLRETGTAIPSVDGVLLVPDVEHNTPPQNLANTYAALTELHHYADARTSFTAWYSESEDGVAETAPPFGRCVVLPSGLTNRGVDAGALLCAETSSAAGAAEARSRLPLALVNYARDWTCPPTATTIADLPQRGAEAHQAYAQAARHSRMDVIDWLPCGAPSPFRAPFSRERNATRMAARRL